MGIQLIQYFCPKKVDRTHNFGPVLERESLVRLKECNMQEDAFGKFYSKNEESVSEGCTSKYKIFFVYTL